jgi:hypothetical protein
VLSLFSLCLSVSFFLDTLDPFHGRDPHLHEHGKTAADHDACDTAAGSSCAALSDLLLLLVVVVGEDDKDKDKAPPTQSSALPNNKVGRSFFPKKNEGKNEGEKRTEIDGPPRLLLRRGDFYRFETFPERRERKERLIGIQVALSR